MTRYSLVVHDGGSSLSVPVEGEAMSPEMARDEAVRLLAGMAQSKAAEGEGQMLVGVVRDGAGQAIYRVLLAFACTRLG